MATPEPTKKHGCARKAALGCGLPILLVLLSPLLIICALGPFNGRVGAPTDLENSPLLKEPPPPLEAPQTLKLITYNIADAYGFTSNRTERVTAIAKRLCELDPDIVGIQEAFIQKDRDLLYTELAPSRLKHHVRFPSATLGNGLLILSAFPIEEAYFWRFTRAGHWWAVWEGDWWAGKGVGLARLRLPGGGVVDFYNTHAQAQRGGSPYNLDARKAQLIEMAQFITDSRCGTAPAFAVGDINTVRTNEDYSLLMQGANLSRVMNIPSLIDHIFAANDPHYRFETLDSLEIQGTTQGSEAVTFLGAPPTWPELKRILFGPAEETSFSDHAGYMSTIRIVPATKTAKLTEGSEK